MKRIVLALALLLSTNSATADYFPSGCYVADYERTDPCWGETASYFNWNDYNFSSTDGEVQYYGSAISTLLQQETLYRLGYSKIVKENDKNKKLIKKLKSKCGSACRSIR